jgi:hypothetical protein
VLEAKILVLRLPADSDVREVQREPALAVRFFPATEGFRVRALFDSAGHAGALLPYYDPQRPAFS